MLGYARLSGLTFLALLACGNASNDPEGERAQIPDDLAAACGALCDARAPCDEIGWTHDECVSACGADVGTPSTECTDAIDMWAQCAEADCNETACGEQHAARDTACGGTG